MNLKLKVFDSKKRFENKKLAELENKMDHYFDEDAEWRSRNRESSDSVPYGSHGRGWPACE